MTLRNCPKKIFDQLRPFPYFNYQMSLSDCMGYTVLGPYRDCLNVASTSVRPVSTFVMSSVSSVGIGTRHAGATGD
jgi:hypothetical protein